MQKSFLIQGNWPRLTIFRLSLRSRTDRLLIKFKRTRPKYSKSLLMKLPLIKHLCTFVEANDEDFVSEAIEVLEHLTEYEGLADQEVDVIGEILSNLYGALEVE